MTSEKLAKALKQAMGEKHYDIWVEASDKLDSGEIGFEEYEKMVSGNHTLIVDPKRNKVTFYDRDLNMTSVAYIDE